MINPEALSVVSASIFRRFRSAWRAWSRSFHTARRYSPELETALQLINTPLSELELLRIENAKLQARLETIDHKAAPTYHFNETVRIAFYIGEKRQIIALSGFYLNALMLAAGIDKKGIAANQNHLTERPYKASQKSARREGVCYKIFLNGVMHGRKD